MPQLVPAAYRYYKKLIQSRNQAMSMGKLRLDIGLVQAWAIRSPCGIIAALTLPYYFASIAEMQL
jgi:hypothetical protein